MRETFIKTWPLFFGLGMMMVGNGLQGTLLGIRAGLEDFSVLATGFIMSAYFIGFLIGSIKVPHYIANVGHIRVFAALASLASTTVLVHGVVVDPISWAIVRAISGFSFAGLFLVVESWLNDAATNKTRGTILGFYLVVTYVGMAVGQLLLNVADPNDIELFVMTSIIVSLALLPIALSTRPAPNFKLGQSLPMREIWKQSPLGILGVTMTGVGSAAIFGIGPVYATQAGLSFASVSAFMTAFLIGSVLCQMPVAYLSDRIDRRKVIITLGLLSACVSLSLYFVDGTSLWVICGVMAVLGGACLPIYGQCASHVNDHLDPSHYVAASSTILLMNAGGAAFGPIIATIMMDMFGKTGFELMVALSFGAIGVFGIYRTRKAAPVPAEKQGGTIFIPARGENLVRED